MSVLSSLPYSGDDSCEENEKGLAVFYPFCRNDIDESGAASGVTIDATNLAVTALTFKSGKYPVKIEFDEDEAFFNQDQVEGKDYKFNQNFYFKRDGLSATTRKILKGYGKQKCMSGVAIDQNGKGWVCGLQYNDKTGLYSWKDKVNGAGTSNTNTVAGDEDAGYTRTFKWENVKGDAIPLIPVGTGVTPTSYMESLLEP